MPDPVSPPSRPLPHPVGSMGVGGAAVIVLAWVLSFWHIAMPDQVSAACTVLFGAGFHSFATWRAMRPFRGAPPAA